MRDACMYMKDYFLGVFIGVLLLLTYVTLPRADYIEPNVFFYLEHLTPLYYLSLIASIVVAVFSKDRFVRIFSTIAFSLLIIFTPSVMLANPWHMDSYPFVTEAVYVQRNGQLADVHYLLQSPALGLVFGPYLLVTGISPFVLMKIYSGLIVTIVVLIISLIAEKMKISEKSSVIAPLCFVAIMWPNTFHFNRQNFSLVYYLASWLFLFQLILERKDRRIFMFLGMQIILMVMAHPATPVFFVANLMGVVIVGKVFRRLGSKEVKSLTYLLLLSMFIWMLWNSTVANTRNLQVITSLVTNLFESLIEGPSRVSGFSKIVIGYTPIYRSIIDIRVLLTLVVSISGILLSFVTYLYYKSSRNKKILTILMGWILSNLSSAVPLLYAGLPYFYRPALFTFISWAPLGGLIYGTFEARQHETKSPNTKGVRSAKLKKTIKPILITIFIIIFILAPSFLLPIVKYAPLPFLHPTTRELSTIKFMDLHREGADVTILEMSTPWTYSYLCGLNGTSYRLAGDDLFVNGSLSPTVAETPLIVTYRLITRDAFLSYNPSMLQIVQNVTQILPETHDKVYDSGWPNWILIPRSNSTK